MTDPVDSQPYSSAIIPLLDAQHLEPLGPGEPDHAARPQLLQLRPETLLGDRPIVDPDMAQCCLAGLWLRHNFLDASHTISQSVASPSGSYWHGMMHRREPDYGNAKYWFRRVGEHPIYARLLQAARGVPPADDDASVQALLGKRSWDACGFVDLCRQAYQHGRSVDWCRRVATAEWQLLFDYCYRAAGATTGAAR